MDLKRLVLSFVLLGGFSNPIAAETSFVEGDFFDSDFLHRPAGQNLPSDLSIFSFSNRLLPGLHYVWLIINEQNFGQFNIQFEEAGPENDATPCLPLKLFAQFGINQYAFPSLNEFDEETCIPLSTLPHVTLSFNHDNNALSVTIPQAAVIKSARGVVPSSLWDHGTTALWSSYDLSHYRSITKSSDMRSSSNTTYGFFQMGLNIGAWRLRGTANLYDTGGNRDWNTHNLYAERDIASWRSRVRVGDTRTSFSTFGSAPIRGVVLSSEKSMLPDSQQGYAPTIRGNAMSNAEIIIRQHERVIYSSFLPPGPFVIDDLYATSGGGDLEVEIKETNGNVTRYIQPYSGLPTMMREGQWDYTLSAGKYNHDAHKDYKPAIGQIEVAYGLPKGLSIYSNFIGSSAYYAGSLGLAANLHRFGALSVDITNTSAENRHNQRLSGQAFRVQYAKNLLATNTNIRFTGTKFNSDNFRSIDQAMAEKANPMRNYSSENTQKSHELQLSLSQNLYDYGSISGSYSRTAFHNRNDSAENYNINYANNFKSIGYSVSLNNNSSRWNKDNKSVMLSLNIPLGNSGNSVSYYFAKNNQGSSSHDASFNGRIEGIDNFSYNLNAGLQKNEQQKDHSAGGSVNYSHRYGRASASYQQGKNNQNYQFNISGAALVDRKGILLGDSIHETAIIVDAPNAKNVELSGYGSIKTNSAGRALIGSAMAYRENKIMLDPLYFSDSATLIDNVATVIPSHGAIVVARFETETGQSRLIQVLINGEPAPFGAAIYDENNKEVGVIGPVGRTWITGISGKKEMSIKWGEEEDKSCSFPIQESEQNVETEEIVTCE